MNAPVKPSLRIASYNICKGRGADLRRRPDRILRTIGGIRADIIALQEADFRFGPRHPALDAEQVTQATGLHVLDIVPDRVSLGWHGIALLARPGHGLQDVRLIDLPGLEPRGTVIADLSTPQGDLRVVAVHLGLLRRNRKQQLSHIHQELARHAKRPTVILGDFNEWSHKSFTKALGPGYSVQSPAPSYPAPRPLVHFDRIAHCDQISVLGTYVPKAPRSHASDHLPIVGDFVLPEMAEL